VNVHGCGIGWYASQPGCGLVDETGLSSYERPAVYTTTSAPLHDRNLRSLAKMVETGLLFGHVRAAGPGASVHQYNCHPFTCGRYLFMHNGDVANFRAVRRSLLTRLRDGLFDWVSGTTVSELLFALFLNALPDAVSLAQRHSPEVLAAALRDTIQLVVEASGGAPSSLNIAVTDGETVLATRFRNGPGEVPPSLYYHSGAIEGDAWDLATPGWMGLGGLTSGLTSDGLLVDSQAPATAGCPDHPSSGRRPSFDRAQRNPRQSLLVSSEPLDGAHGDGSSEWQVFPPNTMLIASPIWCGGEQAGRAASRALLCESASHDDVGGTVLLDLHFESLQEIANTLIVASQPAPVMQRRGSWTEMTGSRSLPPLPPRAPSPST